MNLPEHKHYYEQATKNIMAQLKMLNLSPDKYKRATDLVLKFRKAFTQDEVKKATFITPEDKTWNLGYDSAGFCRVASISFAVAMDFHEWQLMGIDEKSWYGGMGHHWLKHVPTGKVFDLTYDQYEFDGLKVPYYMGQPIKINREAQNTSIRFLHSLGLDFMDFVKYNNAKE